MIPKASIMLSCTPSLRVLRDKLLGINDSPHRIALGAGLGLFLGVFPGTGPIAALVTAFVFRANKAAALAGALAVNTWINVVTFPLALAIGALIWGADPAIIKQEWAAATDPMVWRTFLSFLFHRAMLALGAGYALIGTALGGTGYIVVFALVRRIRKRHECQ